MSAPQPFCIDASSNVVGRFRRLIDDADRDGRGSAAIAAAKVLFNALTWTPQEVGESKGVLPHSGLELRRMLQKPLTVEYAVDKVRRVVVIKQIVLWPMRRQA